jgi:NitT/TauT family transport system substrate-binding protein
MHIMPSRRDFLASASLAAAASVLGTRASLADEGPPETTTVRLLKESGICIAPGLVAEELLRAEGFSDVRYVETEAGSTDAGMVAEGKLDFSVALAPEAVRRIDAGAPIVVLAGVHPGCYELFAYEPVNSIKDLRGRSVAIPQQTGYGPHLWLSLMVAYVGLDPVHDISWVTSSTIDPIELFADGRADAFLGGPPAPQELRARKIGRMILSTATDQPWSQYLCCVLAASEDYVRRYPAATKRVLRAILKANDMCAAEPKWAAKRLVDGGFTPRYDYALQALIDIPYAKWREYDPADSLRFYALRLHEVGMIKSSPNKIIAEGTDWRFLNELKRELKA